MTTLQLSYIVAVAEEHSVSKAAEKLHVAQPSLSRLITSIESKYSIKLFRRSEQKLVLTQAGKIFVDNAQQILNLNRNFENVLQDLGNTQFGKLAFGCSSNHIGYLLSPFLKEISEMYPNWEISVFDDNFAVLFSQLKLGKLDLIYSHMSEIQEKDSSLEYYPITKEELLLAVPLEHPFSERAIGIDKWGDRQPIQPEEIAREPFIQLKPAHSTRILTDQIFSSHKIKPNVRFEVSSNAVAHKLTSAGLGISILPESELRFNPTSPPCVYFPIAERKYTRQIYLCYSKSYYQTTIIGKSVEIISRITNDLFEKR